MTYCIQWTRRDQTLSGIVPEEAGKSKRMEFEQREYAEAQADYMNAMALGYTYAVIPACEALEQITTKGL